MKISGSVASYSLAQVQHLPRDDVEERQPAAHAQQRLGALHAHRGAEAAVELDHRRRADRLGGVVVGDLDVAQRRHVDRLDRRLGDHPGLAVLEQPVVVRERLDGQRVDTGVEHLVAGLDQPRATHAVDRRLAADRGKPGGESAKIALRDQVVTARNRRSLRGAVRGRPATSPTTCWPPRRYGARPPWRRTSRSARSPAPALLLREPRRRPASGSSCRSCCPTATSTGRRTPATTSLAPARLGLLEPVGPRLGVDAVATADVVLVPGPRRLADRRPAGPRRRLLRPRTRPGAGRHVHLRAAPRRRGRPRRPGRAARPPGHRGRDPVRDLVGSSVSVCSSASSTASCAERPRQRLAARPQVGLVGVVLAGTGDPRRR